MAVNTEITASEHELTLPPGKLVPDHPQEQSEQIGLPPGKLTRDSQQTDRPTDKEEPHQEHQGVQAHGGPWIPKGTNPDGAMVFENPNGVRAIMEDGVPWTELTQETEKGLVPKQSGGGKRKPQFEVVEKLPEAAKSANVSTSSSGGESVADG
jgi:hypothetical protein